MAVTVFDQHFSVYHPNDGNYRAYGEQTGWPIIVDRTTCCRGFPTHIIAHAPGGAIERTLIYEGSDPPDCDGTAEGTKQWSSAGVTLTCPSYEGSVEVYLWLEITSCNLQGAVLEVRRSSDDHVFARYRNHRYGWGHGGTDTNAQLEFAECDTCAPNIFWAPPGKTERDWPQNVGLFCRFGPFPNTICGSPNNVVPSAASFTAASDGTFVGVAADGATGSTISNCYVSGTGGSTNTSGTTIDAYERDPPGTDVYEHEVTIEIPAMTGRTYVGQIHLTNNGPQYGRLWVVGQTLTNQYVVNRTRIADSVVVPTTYSAMTFAASYGTHTDSICDNNTLVKLSEHIRLSAVAPASNDILTVTFPLHVAAASEMFPTDITLAVTP